MIGVVGVVGVDGIVGVVGIEGLDGGESSDVLVTMSEGAGFLLKERKRIVEDVFWRGVERSGVDMVGNKN